MKNSTRIFIFLALLLSYSGLSAAHRSAGQSPADNGAVQSFRITPVPAQINAVPFYSEDFGSGLPSGWQTIDNAGNGVNWKWTTTGIYHVGSTPGLDTLNSTGTTASNGYMMFDSDSSNGTLTGEDADLISGSIDCSLYNVVHLRFNQLLYHFAESAKVYVSNDGTNWNEVYDASAGLATGQATPNPDVVDIDITAYAALQSTVYLKFNYIGDFDYWWMIDDIEMYEPAAADAGVFAITTPTTSCTLLSSTETVSVEVYNFGSDSISGFDVSYVVNGGTAVTETITDTIAPGFSYSYAFATTADFSSPGTFTISAYTSLSGDAENTNDTSSTSIFNGAIQVTTSSPYTMGFEANEDFNRWSYEDGNFDGNFWMLSGTLARTGVSCARMATPSAAVSADDWLFTPCLDLSDTISYDLEFYYRTLSTATQANIEVMIGSLPAGFGMSQSIKTQTFVNNLNYIRSLDNFSVAFAGVYYIGFHVTNADSTTSLRIDDINIAASSGVGIRNTDISSFSIYPNPSNGMFQIKGKGLTQNSKLSVLNTMGQVVYSTNYSDLQLESIDLSKQPEGQYLIRIISDAGVTTQSVSVLR